MLLPRVLILPDLKRAAWPCGDLSAASIGPVGIGSHPRPRGGASGSGGRAPPEDSRARPGAAWGTSCSSPAGFGDTLTNPSPLVPVKPKLKSPPGAGPQPPAGGRCSWKTNSAFPELPEASGTCCRTSACSRCRRGASLALSPRGRQLHRAHTGADARCWMRRLAARPPRGRQGPALGGGRTCH